jgi:hypothetical protein
MTFDDRNDDSQLSRAHEWLNDAMDPSREDASQEQEGEDDDVEEEESEK